MRKFPIIVLSFFSVIASATDYYVRSTGNDNNRGTSSEASWKSISKVNSSFSTFKPGDRVLFKRGDKFNGTLNISLSGTQDAPITIGAFGTGENPIVSGFISLSGWTKAGNGIYSKIVSAESPINMVTIENIQFGMGRFPNSGYLTYESHKSNSSITDNHLLSFPNWTGAEVVINKQNWLLDRCLILNHTGHTLHYSSYGSLNESADNRGYFIQNDLKTLDTFGEWYFNKSESRLYIFFGDIIPDTKTVKVATVNNLIYNNAKSYITVDGLSFEGSIEDAICSAWGEGCVIKNCIVKFSGGSGLDIRGKNNKISSNNISFCDKAGIYVEGANPQITLNNIKNIGLIPGSTVDGSLIEGIFGGGENSFIQFNTVSNIGGMGIRIGSGWTTQIKNNLIDNFLLTLNDGGGIYIDGKLEKPRLVEGNIILNGKGNSVGSSPAACGIYLDEYSCNVLVKDNTVAYNSYGINLHKANTNTIINNLTFGNKVQIALHNTDFLPTIYRNKINNNIFFSSGNSSLALFFNSKTDDIRFFGKADDNYYAIPADNDKLFYTFSPFTGKRYRTFSGWQTFSSQDANSHYSLIPNDTANIDFYYNASGVPRIIILSEPMIDIKGIKYITSITLPAYTSIILFPDQEQSTPSVIK